MALTKIKFFEENILKNLSCKIPEMEKNTLVREAEKLGCVLPAWT
jgi:hypothetical protein